MRIRSGPGWAVERRGDTVMLRAKSGADEAILLLDDTEAVELAAALLEAARIE